MKTCKKCGRTLPETEYYARASSCKECTRNAVKRNRQSNIERIRQYDRYRSKQPHRKQAHILASREYNKTHRIEKLARLRLFRAVKSGKVSKKPCAVCGCADSQAHHHDYSRPLDVVWLCDAHHKQLHAGSLLELQAI